MNSSKHIGLWAKLALFFAALIWGASFIVMKDSVTTFPPNILLGIRFTIATLLLCVIFFRRLKLFNREYLFHGGVIGLCLFLAYCTQTIGLTGTTPGKNAFLTAVYCVLVPFLLWAFYKARPDIFNCAAAVLCITGIGLVALDGNFTMGYGDALTLVGGFFFAMHMITVSRFSQNKDPVLLTITQFGFVAIFSWITGLIFEPFPTEFPAHSWGGILYLAVFATALCLLLQNVGQKYTAPASAAILLSLESVFGILFSVLFYDEPLSPRLICGFVLIFVAVITSETKLSFLFPKKNKAPTA
ncbi:MAG: DMT family transporter [Oscillospiraceae bacterium]|nr:DMT family transporter [Oscillospiraceae bacterium]